MLSYQHHYHVGNHADVLKHWILFECVRYLQRKNKPFEYIDSHAGAGLYNLDDGKTQKLKEFESGFNKLLAEAPEQFKNFINVILPFWQARQYPGSPALVDSQMREGDRSWLFELHPQTFAELEKHCARYKRVFVRKQSGFEGLLSLLPSQLKRALILIDPAYEINSDYQTVVNVIAKGYQKMPSATFLLWYPVVNRDTIDALEQRFVSTNVRNVQQYELNISADTEAKGMTGSGMIVINPPYTLAQLANENLPLLTSILGEDAGANFKVKEIISE